MNQILASLLSVSLLSAAAGAIAQAPAAGSDETSPHINPQRDCLTEGMINPAGKEFRYLYSKNCRVVHVLPPPVLPQAIKSQGVNLDACQGMATAKNTIDVTAKTIDDMRQRIRRLEAKLETAKPHEVEALNAKLQSLRTRSEQYEKTLDESRSRFDQHYAQLPGAVFSVLLDSDIQQNELNELRSLNLANLHRRRTIERRVRDANGNERVETQEVVDVSALRAAPIAQSFFSFIYNVPKDARVNAGIISTDIPNLQYLQQPDGRTGVIHVKASGGISGKVIMSVTAACEYASKRADGKIVFDDSADPFFTVNRTFMVQQMFAKGYRASLKVDKLIDQISKHTVTHTNSGFKKSNLFNPILMADIEQLLDFQWTTEFDNGKPISLDQILDIKRSVTEKLIDDHVEKLVQAKLITVQEDRKVEPVPGGMVDESRVAHRCWTEKDGGLSGLLGRRHQVCADFTYTVKVWKDGITEDEIRRHLNIKSVEKDAMEVNFMTPFYFTTSFSNKNR